MSFWVPLLALLVLASLLVFFILPGQQWQYGAKRPVPTLFANKLLSSQNLIPVGRNTLFKIIVAHYHYNSVCFTRAGFASNLQTFKTKHRGALYSKET